MELETVNKLYLELSQIATAKTARELELEKREMLSTDEKVVSGLILLDENGDLGVISSGLIQDFKERTNVFNVRYPNGTEFKVSVKMEEI